MSTTTRRPLRCANCGAGETHIHVPGAGNMRKVRGRRRKATWCRCTSCGHEWTSTAKRALAIGREADRKAAA
jgi:hypothetical protein